MHTIGGYSARADQKGLVNFITRMRQWPQLVRLVHYDLEATKTTLKQKLEALGIEQVVL